MPHRACALLLVLLVALALAPGVGGAAPSGGGEFSMPIQSDPNMSPIVGFDTASVMVNKVLFNGLTKPDERTQSPAPDLAESWSVSPDGLVWTFKLRRGVKWHDGTPFTADDVKFSMDLVRDPKVNSRWRSNLIAVKDIRVTGPYEVQFVMLEPFSPLPVFLGYNMGIVPGHVLQGTDVNANPAFTHQHPIGTGPYRIQDVRAGEYVRFTANPDFYFGAPKIPVMNFKIIPDQNVQIAQLKTGELSFVWIEPFSLKALEGTPGVVINQGNQINFYYISLNKTNPLFQDRRVRLALTLAINRQAIVSGIMKGYATLASDPWNPFLKNYFETTSQFPFDPPKARALLAEAGWKAGPNGVLQKDGKPFTFVLTTLKGNPSLEQIGVLAQQYWKQVGLDPQLEALEFSVFINGRRDNRFGPNASQALVHFWVTPPTPDLYGYFGCPAGKDGNNTGVYCNPDADKLFLAGRRAASLEQQRQIYHKLQELFTEDVPEVPLFYPVELRAMSDKLRNVSPLGVRDALLYSYQWSFAK
ncbi:MAG TPA: ABC transporter substrate-binding protein [bacterium]|nr:ABC transporter substrate-binding protein [bacterium]